MAGRLVFVAIAGLIALAACSEHAPPALADSNGPPVGKERAAISAWVRAYYPAMPGPIVELMTDARQSSADGARCELVEWLAGPDSGARSEDAALSKRMISYCELGIHDLDPAIAAHRLGGESFRFDVVGDEVTMLAHSIEPHVDICCSLQLAMTRLDGSQFWAARRRLADVDRAMLSLFVAKAERTPDHDIMRFRGANAPAAPLETLPGKLAGKLFDRELNSAALGETRRLSIYLPPGWSKERVWPALFLADNSASIYAPMVDAMIATGAMAPIVLISAESGAPAVVGIAPTIYGPDLRSAEYLRNRVGGDARFNQHMTFFAEELTRYAIDEFAVSERREDRAVAGFSSGAVFALWAGLLHPQVYSYAIPMSPGMAVLKVDDLNHGVRARFRFAGGLYEPPFIATAQAAEAVLKLGGYDASGLYLSAGHDPDQWKIVMQAALIEIFPPVSAL
jgi:enterochelin esterase-like enzyme